MAYLLALDQGTSSSRSIIFDQSGAIVATAQQEFPQIFPQPYDFVHRAAVRRDDVTHLLGGERRGDERDEPRI